MAEEAAELNQEEETKLRQEIASKVFGDDYSLEGEQDPSPEPEPEPELDQDPEPEQEPEPEPDPWADVPPVLREQLEGITGKLSNLDTIEYRLKQTERRIGSIQNEFQNAAKAAANVDSAPSKEEMAKAAESEEGWKDLKETFPKWAAAFDDKISGVEKQFKPVVDTLASQVDELRSNLITPAMVEERVLSAVHPNYKAVVQTPDYQKWLQSQPKDVQIKAMQSQRASDAISILNAFTEFKTKAKANKDRLRKSVLPKKGRTDKQKSEADMSELEYRRMLAKKKWG